MEIPPPFQQLPADPKFVDQIVNQIKSQGTFDQWRRECLADVDTRPAYQNLTFRVDNAVTAFLVKQRWRPDMVKNQVRENLRKHIIELGIIDKGVDRIVEQVVQPKVLPLFHPAVENAIYSFLGIKNPRTENGNQNVETNSNASPKKTFRPMPVTVRSREKEDGTPPPGEEFELEAITPSSESRCGSSLKKDLADDISDVSMEESRPLPEAGLERICSPVSPQSSHASEKPEDNEAARRSRVGSALSAISSGDDLPSTSPVAASPVTSDEFHENQNVPEESRPNDASPESSDDENDEDDEEDDDEDDFSSPEFEKIELTAPTSRTVTPVPGEESQDGCDNNYVADDHYAWRPKPGGRDPDRKPDEDPGESGPKQSGEAADKIASSQSSDSTNKVTGDGAVSGKSTTVTSNEAEGTKKEKSAEGSSKERSRSKSESHKSDRRDKSRKDKDRDRERQRDRERRREREKESERRSKSHHSKSSHRDRDERKKSSHRDKDRDSHRDKGRESHRDKDRDRNRSKSNHESDRRHKERKQSERATEKREVTVSPSPALHPKAYLWKRPAEKPQGLWDYLARFPDDVFDELYDGDDGLSNVSVSSVSTYEDSDSDGTIILHVSDVEIDSEVEEAVTLSGGRIAYRDAISAEGAKHAEDETLESDYTPVSDDFVRSESYLRDQQHNINNNKRVRKLNTRYSDSYVGSELRKIITTQPEASQKSPRYSNKYPHHRENQENNMQDSSPEEVQPREDVMEYQPPDAKRLKTDQPLPSSPESVQSDLTHLPHAPSSTPPPGDIAIHDEDSRKDNISPNGRRRSAVLKQPQQRYDDTDLYKPRPVITPSSRRSRRQDDS